MKNLPILLFLITTLLMLGSCRENKVSKDEKVINEKSDKTYPKLFLLSKGLTTDTLRNEFLNFLEKEPATLSVAVVINASSTDMKNIKRQKR